MDISYIEHTGMINEMFLRDEYGVEAYYNFALTP
jgi:hypothetical protein